MVSWKLQNSADQLAAAGWVGHISRRDDSRATWHAQNGRFECFDEETDAGRRVRSKGGSLRLHYHFARYRRPAARPNSSRPSSRAFGLNEDRGVSLHREIPLSRTLRVPDHTYLEKFLHNNVKVKIVMRTYFNVNWSLNRLIQLSISMTSYRSSIAQRDAKLTSLCDENWRAN